MEMNMIKLLGLVFVFVVLAVFIMICIDCMRRWKSRQTTFSTIEQQSTAMATTNPGHGGTQQPIMVMGGPGYPPPLTPPSTLYSPPGAHASPENACPPPVGHIPEPPYTPIITSEKSPTAASYPARSNALSYPEQPPPFAYPPETPNMDSGKVTPPPPYPGVDEELNTPVNDEKENDHVPLENRLPSDSGEPSAPPLPYTEFPFVK